MAKVHKSLRLDEGTVGRVRALMEGGETEAAAWQRVVEAGLDALEGAVEYEEPAGEDGRGRDFQRDAEPAGVVREYIDVLREQLDEKDEQIRRLQEAATVGALARAEGGAWRRVKAFFSRGKGEDEE